MLLSFWIKIFLMLHNFYAEFRAQNLLLNLTVVEKIIIYENNLKLTSSFFKGAPKMFVKR